MSEKQKKNNYWEERNLAQSKRQFKKGDEFNKRLAKEYKKAKVNINKDIEHWYNRLAANNNVTLAEAKKLLKADELEEFKWSVEEYIEKGKANSFNGKYMKELENASAKVHITRLEAIKTQMDFHVASVMNFEEKGLTELLKDVYEDDYYKTAFNVQKAVGVGKDLYRLNTDKIEKVISKPWAKDGLDFSERIWGSHRKELSQKLSEGITQVLAGGKSKDELIKELAKLVDKNVADAEYASKRLVNSELSYISSLSRWDSYKDNDVEEYEVLAALELGKGRRTCDRCAEMDGKIYKLDEYEIGVTAPLFHPDCRCTTAPVVDNVITRNSRNTRAAKIEGVNDGKTTFVENMTFKEWEERFVKGEVTSNTKAKKDTFKVPSVATVNNIVNEAEKLKNNATNVENNIEKSAESGIIKSEALSIYFNSSENLFKYAKKVKPTEGYEDIFIHGDKTGFSYVDKNGKESYYTVREFAKILREDPNYKGGNIKLYSCETGADGATTAQSLANQLGVEVLAPTDVVWIDFEGNVIIGPSEFENTGKWVKFKPKKG